MPNKTRIDRNDCYVKKTEFLNNKLITEENKHEVRFSLQKGKKLLAEIWVNYETDGTDEKEITDLIFHKDGFRKDYGKRLFKKVVEEFKNHNLVLSFDLVEANPFDETLDRDFFPMRIKNLQNFLRSLGFKGNREKMVRKPDVSRNIHKM